MKYGQPMISRDTRRLLVTIAVSIALLWVLARIRFQETATQTPVAPVLAQLRPAANYDDLARLVADVRPIVAAAVVPAGTGTAFRVSSDRAVTLHPHEGMTVIAKDRATQLAVVAVAEAEPAGVIPWMPRVLDYPRFFLVGERTVDRVSVRPIFVGTLTAAISPYWETEVWLVPTGVDLPAGRFVFTTEGALAGLSIVERGHSAIVPAAQLLQAAQRIAEAPPGPVGTLGVDVQPLSPALAAAAGTDSGVIVTMVDPAGAAADVLAPTDVVEAVNGHTIESIDDWRARILRIEAGDTVSLRVRAAGERREVQVKATSAAPPAPRSDTHGLGLQLAPANSGSRVIGVQPGSSGAHASLQAGDLITAVGRQLTPTPSEVARAFAALPPGETLIVAFSRGTTHQLATLRKTRPGTP
jgi:PDZ domain